MSTSVDDELQLLESIFSARDESVEILSRFPNQIISVSISVGTGIPLKITFELTHGYPETIPKIQVDSHLSREQSQYFASNLMKHAESNLKGQPMLLDLCSFAQDFFMTSSKAESQEEEVNRGNKSNKSFLSSSFISVVEIDHMRDRKNYVKLLSLWANELAVAGNVIFHSRSKRILMVLCSDNECQLKEFHQRHRTNIVDVDSSGRPCKERQMSFLCPTKRIFRVSTLKGFSALDLPDEDFKDFADYFERHNLSEIYNSFLT